MLEKLRSHLTLRLQKPKNRLIVILVALTVSFFSLLFDVIFGRFNFFTTTWALMLLIFSAAALMRFGGTTSKNASER